ncbi:hypothetical protein N9D31_03185 [Oligoflexaceae bacterium]|nr:hypothetical protein [Oligoflexaceae bacterium]
MWIFRLIGLSIIGFGLSSCGLSDDFTASSLKVVLVADNTPPEGAEGISSPKSIEATIANVFWTLSTETEIQELLDPAPEDVTIINRERIIIEKDIKELKGESFSNLVVQLALEIDVLGKYEIAPLDFEPTSAGGNTLDLIIEGPIEIEEGKDIVATIKCQWYKTVTSDDDSLTDEITLPSFDFSISN